LGTFPAIIPPRQRRRLAVRLVCLPFVVFSHLTKGAYVRHEGSLSFYNMPLYRTAAVHVPGSTVTGLVWLEQKVSEFCFVAGRSVK
jgi:hypothetical protein